MAGWPAFLASGSALGLAVAPDVRGLLLPDRAARAGRRGAVLRRARPPGTAAPTRRARSRGDPARAGLAVARRAGGARGLRRRPLPRPQGHAGRRPSGGVPGAGVRGRRPALRAGAHARPRHSLHRRFARIGALAQARHRAVGACPAPRGRAGARRRRGTARPVLAPRGTRRQAALIRRERLSRLRGRVPVRGNDRPARGDRGRARRHALGQADGPRGLRRRRLRQDRGCAAGRVRRRHRRPAGRRARADDAARAAARPDLRRPLRRLAGAGREPVALSHRLPSSARWSRDSRPARSTS